MMYHDVSRVKRARAMHRSRVDHREVLAMATHQRHTQPRGVRLAHDLRGEVQDLLDRFARALVANDGDTIAALWETPALVVSAERVIAVNAQAEVARVFGDAKAQYAARGIVDTRADLLDLERVGERIAIATVRWPYLDAAGHAVGAESSDYTLRRDDAGRLRIRAVLVRGVEGGSHTKPS